MAKSHNSHEFGHDENHQDFTEAYPNWETEAGLMKHWTRYSRSYFGQFKIIILNFSEGTHS